jgi:hypothetical protein
MCHGQLTLQPAPKTLSSKKILWNCIITVHTGTVYWLYGQGVGCSPGMGKISLLSVFPRPVVGPPSLLSFYPRSKSKAIPITGCGGLEMLRIPHCLDNRLIDGGKVVSPTHQPRFTPQKHYYFFNVSSTNLC